MSLRNAERLAYCAALPAGAGETWPRREMHACQTNGWPSSLQIAAIECVRVGQGECVDQGGGEAPLQAKRPHIYIYIYIHTYRPAYVVVEPLAVCASAPHKLMIPSNL